MVSAILELSLRPEDKIDLIPGYRVKGCVRATGTAPAHRERSPTRPSARRSHRTDNAPARRATAPVLTPSGQRPCKIVQERLVPRDRKSTRLNSSHSQISYAVFCLKKKKKTKKKAKHKIYKDAIHQRLRTRRTRAT